MELLKNSQQTHDETWPVTFDGFVRLPLHERTGMRTKIQGLKRENSQECKQKWELFELLTQAVHLFHRVDKACKFHCLCNVLKHVL